MYNPIILCVTTINAGTSRLKVVITFSTRQPNGQRRNPFIMIFKQRDFNLQLLALFSFQSECLFASTLHGTSTQSQLEHSLLLVQRIFMILLSRVKWRNMKVNDNWNNCYYITRYLWKSNRLENHVEWTIQSIINDIHTKRFQF